MRIMSKCRLKETKTEKATKGASGHGSHLAQTRTQDEQGYDDVVHFGDDTRAQ